MDAKVLHQAAFHAAVIVIYFFTTLATLQMPPLPHKPYLGNWKYLTYWYMAAQTMYFVFAFCTDFMKISSSNYRRFTKIRDTLYASILFPYCLFVGSVFWTLYTIDREIILPKMLDAVFPLWLNHTLHTLILPILLIETCILRHRYPDRKNGLIVTAAFGLTYQALVVYLGVTKNVWAYPLLDIINWNQRILVFFGSIVYVASLYLFGEKINNCSSRDETPSKKK